MLGRIGRMSSWSSIRMTAAAVAGLAARRMYLAHFRLDTWILGEAWVVRSGELGRPPRLLHEPDEHLLLFGGHPDRVVGCP
jgi:hypothetical protein